MIALGDIQDPQLNFKIGDEQVHSIWQGSDLIWPMDSGLLFINANWRVLPPFPVFAEVWTGNASPSDTLLWTSAIFTISQTGCMNFGVYGPLANTIQQYTVRIRKPETFIFQGPGIPPVVDPERNIDAPGSTAGYGICPANEYLEVNASNGQVFISGNQAWNGYPQLVFDIFSVS
jgi:hypothetical protein